LAQRVRPGLDAERGSGRRGVGVDDSVEVLTGCDGLARAGALGRG
jgi:hypothetical protein